MHSYTYLKQYFYQFVAILICYWAIGPLAAGALETDKAKVIATTRLDKVAAISATRRLPVLLVFSSNECPYCKLQEEEILKPMLISGEYDDKVIIRKVLIDEEVELVNFKGEHVSVDDFVSHYRVYVVPTIVFLDHRGRELAKRLIGINTIEMFGGDVDEAIDLSLKKLRK